MVEINPPTDEAVPYVLGELNAPQRVAFERRLAESQELRASVRELEDGMVALSLALPKRQPPNTVWTGIEKAVAREHTRPVFVPTPLWAGWWRNGWLAAAACMVGWLLYALYVSRPGPQDSSSTPVASSVAVPTPQQDAPRSNLFSDGTGTTPTQPTTTGDSVSDSTQAGGQESNALRWQIAQLSNRMSELSHAVTQQQLWLSEPSRVKVFQLSAPSVENSEMAMAPISTNLQRALFLAMAREFGWLPVSAGSSPEIAGANEQPGASSRVPTNTQAGIDFVDLRPTSDTTTTITATPSANVKDEPSPATQADTTSPSSQPLLASATPTNSNPISGFISGTNAVLAFDSSVVPAGSALTFQTMSPSGQYQSLGTTVLGTNAMVVTIPFSVRTWLGGNISVLAGGVMGNSNNAIFLGQFPPVRDTSR